MRVVVAQGQYGIFKTNSLELSMPAVQTCIGLFAYEETGSFILCAHFDTYLALRENLNRISTSLHSRGLRFCNLNATIFGGDGRLSYLRCSPPSSFIGEALVELLHAEGCRAVYSDRYYSGLLSYTFNLHYLNGHMDITIGINPRGFYGIHPLAKNLAQQRIQKSPHEYNPIAIRTNRHPCFRAISRIIDSSQAASGVCRTSGEKGKHNGYGVGTYRLV